MAACSAVYYWPQDQRGRDDAGRIGILPVWHAIREPAPEKVQQAVKRCIMGLVVLDAILALALAGPPGLLILLLLLPALYLGKWIYST